MIGVDSTGSRVEVAGPALLGGTDAEIRGLFARFLVTAGLKVDRASKILRSSRSQFYDDMKAARRDRTPFGFEGDEAA